MRFFALLNIVLVGAAILAACGPGAAATSQSPVAVEVTLAEFKIESSLTNFKTNTSYHFTVKNAGTVNHDFSITPPVMQHGGVSMSSDDVHKDAVLVIEAGDLPPGATKTAEVTFTTTTGQAPLEFACHTPGHYEADMLLPITVN